MKIPYGYDQVTVWRSRTSLYSGISFTYLNCLDWGKKTFNMHALLIMTCMEFVRHIRSWAKSHIRCSYHMNYIMWLNHTVKAVRLLILVLAEPVNTCDIVELSGYLLCAYEWYYVHMNAGYLINRLYSTGLWTRVGVKPWIII